MKNVLIIDDEKSLLFSIKKGFEPFRDEVTLLTAENGFEALAILESQDVDLVVTDLKMPGMDGFELLAHLSEQYPGMPAMVMTAFNTPEIEKRLNGERTMTLFDKPVNFEEFTRTILEAVRSDAGECPFGISISSFMQLIQSEQKTCLLEVKIQDKTGYIYFEDGELINAAFSGLKGEDAIYSLMGYPDVQIGFKKIPKKKIKRIIHASLMQILMEGMRRLDEQRDESWSDGEARIEDHPLDMDDQGIRQQPEDHPETAFNPFVTEKDPSVTQHPNLKGVNHMASIKETLEKFKAVDGFMAAGAFSPNGELVTELNVASVNIAELGALANDVLLKAQKATEIMGVGRGQLVHVEAPKAHIFARCLNESTDYAVTSSGRAHVHLVIVVDREGNVAMAKMRLENIIMEIAEHFR